MPSTSCAFHKCQLLVSSLFLHLGKSNYSHFRDKEIEVLMALSRKVTLPYVASVSIPPHYEVHVPHKELLPPKKAHSRWAGMGSASREAGIHKHLLHPWLRLLTLGKLLLRHLD